MSISKSCKAIVGGMPVEIVVLDAAGNAFDHCQEHNTFAVSPGQFSVKATLTTDVKSLRQYAVQRRHSVRFGLSIDGQYVAASRPSLTSHQVSCIFEDTKVNKSGTPFRHALEFAKPQADALAASGATATGNLGTINIAVSQVTVERCKTSSNKQRGPVASRANSSRGDKKFFMEQGVTFKTGPVKLRYDGRSVKSYEVSGGFKGSIRYDMTEYLRLRACFPAKFMR